MKRPRWRFEPPRRLFRCPSCSEVWRTEHCPYCDPDARLPDKLTLARLRAERSAGGPVHTGIDPATLVDAELGRRTLLPEELLRLARAYRVPPFVFGVKEG